MTTRIWPSWVVRVESLWLILGIVVLGATLADVFLTALNYDESGFLTGPVAAWQWRFLRSVTRRLPRRWRPLALRQVTGLQVVVMIVVWVCGTILGYGLIYFSQMSSTSFTPSGGDRELNLFDALYFSAAQLATVGGSVLTAETDPLRFISIVESLTGVVLISLILTYLLGVYDVIGSLNTLCRQFSPTERGAGSVFDTLTPYFHDGEAEGLDSHLDSISDALTSYMDGLRLHHAAYYFQSGRDQFALPYALRMVGGTLGALRWGLPTGHPASLQPTLPPLVFQFVEFADQLQARLRWRDLDVPEVVTRDVFAAHAGIGSLTSPRDPWVMSFLGVDAQMARLASVAPLADVDDTYRRYTEWLPFAYRSRLTTLAVSDELDYQPLIVSDNPVSVLAEHNPVVLGSVETVPGVAPWTTRQEGTTSNVHPPARPRFVRERAGQVDPGHARLRDATRALVAAGGAVVSLHLVLDALGLDAPLPAAIFGGFVAMLIAGVATAPGLRQRRLTSLLVVVPVWLVLLLGAVTTDYAWLRDVSLVAVAFVGVGASRFGSPWGPLGRVAFMAFYFALILRLDLADAPWFMGAALAGALWAYVCSYLLLPDRPAKILEQGVEALVDQMTSSVDTLVDAVSWSRWDPDIRRRVGVDMTRTMRSAAFVAGRLVRGSDDPDEVRAADGLRLRVFDAELAMVNLKNAARSVTSTSPPLEARGRLAGRLELVRADLIARRHPESLSAPLPDLPREDHIPETWPREARRMLRAVDEFHRAVVSLLGWRSDPRSIDPLDPREPDADAALDALAVEAQPTRKTPTQQVDPPVRRAVQAAAASAAGLAIGTAVSGSHQYWATLAAYQTLGTTDGETLANGVRRVFGTVVGAGAGFAIALSSNGRPEVMVPVLAVALFYSVYYRPVASGVSTFWTTLIFAGIYEFLGRLTSVALELRIVETLLGALAALVVARWVLPTHTRSKVNQDMSTVTGNLHVVTRGCLERVAGRGDISRGAVQQRLLAIDEQVRALRTDAAPARYTLGSYEAGGIDAQLTAVWSMAATVRHLAHAVERAREQGQDTSGPDWAEISARVEQSTTALMAALSDRVPSKVDDELGGVVDDALLPQAAREIYDLVDRLNRTMLALVEALSPDRPEDE